MIMTELFTVRRQIWDLDCHIKNQWHAALNIDNKPVLEKLVANTRGPVRCFSCVSQLNDMLKQEIITCLPGQYCMCACPPCRGWREALDPWYTLYTSSKVCSASSMSSS